VGRSRESGIRPAPLNSRLGGKKRCRDRGSLHLFDPLFYPAGKPFLGICLGLQLLFTRSSEDGDYPGLDLFPGEVVRFPDLPGF
jgi:hypothetical protein